MTDFIMPNNISCMKYALRSVPGLADVGVLPNFAMPNNTSSMIYSLKSDPGLADVGVLLGDEDGPVAQAPGSGSKMSTYHVDQHEKLKGLSV